MRKWRLYLLVSLSIWMVGCASQQAKDVKSDKNYKSGGIERPKTMNIDEEIDDHLYVAAEFHMPEEELSTYSSELKQFDYDKVQSVLWPSARADQVTVDEFGDRYYGDESFGVESGSLIYRANNDGDYIETLCSYAKEKNMISKKNLKFASIEAATDEAEQWISKFGIGCELGEPFLVALNGKDLNKVQKAIMQDDDYKDILRAKKLGNSHFDSRTEVYYFDYSFVIHHIHVFGHDDPTVQYSGDNPLLAHNMRATMLISKAGIEMFSLEGVLDRLAEKSGKAEIIGYEGIREALEKKFGDVILTDEYKVTNIWMEYFPLIQADSFNQVEVIPVWCCDFEINGEAANYTLRFHAITGEEIS